MIKRSSPVEKIENKLPNGFHDAALIKYSVNFEIKKIEFTFDVDVSGLDEEKIRYRRGRLLLSNVEFFMVEPPGAMVSKNGGVRCEIGVLAGKRLAETHRKKLPGGFFAHYIFIHESNSFIYFVFREAKFEWV